MSPREFEAVGNLTNDSFPITIVENNPDPGVRWLQSNAVKTDEIDGGNTDVSRIFAGHWPDLYVGIRQEMEIELLREKFSATNQVAFLCSMRADVIPVRQGSFGMITGIRPDGAS
jgi:HK97 family phage major capsid protein